MAFLRDGLKVRTLVSASRFTARFAAISENARTLRFASLEGLRTKPHDLSKQVRNDQDGSGVYDNLEITIGARSPML
jgi:hypothetical protein